MQCVGTGSDELHRWTRDHQRWLHEHTGKEAGHRAQQMSVDWPHARKDSAAGRLLCATQQHPLAPLSCARNVDG